MNHPKSLKRCLIGNIHFFCTLEESFFGAHTLSILNDHYGLSVFLKLYVIKVVRLLLFRAKFRIWKQNFILNGCNFSKRCLPIVVFFQKQMGFFEKNPSKFSKSVNAAILFPEGKISSKWLSTLFSRFFGQNFQKIQL